MASRTRLPNMKETPGSGHLTSAPTSMASRTLRAWLGAVTVAVPALPKLAKGNFFFAPVRRLFEANFKIVTQVRPATGPATLAAAAPKELFEDTAAAATLLAENFAKHIGWIIKTTAARATLTAPLLERRMTVTIIGRPFIGVF